MKVLNQSAIVLAAGLLCACGGGGGGEQTTYPLSVTFSQAAFSDELLEGQSKDYSVWANAQGDYAPAFEVTALDQGGALNTPAVDYGGDFRVYRVDFSPRPDLAPGRHAGRVLVRACTDSSCGTVLGQGTVSYAFTVVRSEFHATPLAPWPGIGEWGTDQRDAGHSGFVPVTLDASKFTTRWRWDSPVANDPYSWLFPPVSDSSLGLLYELVVTGSNRPAPTTLYALHEADHSVAWSVDLPGYLSVSTPAVADGRVYVATFTSAGTKLLAFDAATGAPAFSTEGPSISNYYIVPGAPIYLDGSVYVNFGASGDTNARHGRVLAYNGATGEALWTSATGGYAYIAPAADNDHIYFYRPNSNYTSYVPDGFTALNRATGATAFTVVKTSASNQEGQVYYNGGAPVLDGAGGVLVNNNPVNGQAANERYGIAGQNLAWQAGVSAGPPTVHGDVYYSVQETQLQARRVADGSVLWVWNPPAVGAYRSIGSVVATNNLVFFSTDKAVYAVSSVTHALAWSYPVAGSLSLSSSGLLYITQGDNRIVAINLQ